MLQAKYDLSVLNFILALKKLDFEPNTVWCKIKKQMGITDAEFSAGLK